MRRPYSSGGWSNASNSNLIPDGKPLRQRAHASDVRIVDACLLPAARDEIKTILAILQRAAQRALHRRIHPLALGAIADAEQIDVHVPARGGVAFPCRGHDRVQPAVSAAAPMQESRGDSRRLV